MGLEQVPSGAMSIVLSFVGAIVDVLQAGSDLKKREEALMKAAEDVKAELDRIRFG